MELDAIEELMPGPGEVLVQTSFTAVSPGTERASLLRLPNAGRAFPQYPGYSGAGQIVAVGPRVSRLRVGDVVAAGVHHASVATLPENRVFSVPKELDLAQASFFQLGVIALQAFRKGRPAMGQRVAILGQGLVGQLLIQLSVACGAHPVTAVARTPARADLSEYSGAHHVLSLERDYGAVDGVDADLTYEATGNPAALHAAIRCTRAGGRIVLAGSSRGVTEHLDLHHIARDRALTLVGAHVATMPKCDSSSGAWTQEREGKTFLRFLQLGTLRLGGLITDRVSPAESGGFYRRLCSENGRTTGAVFDWGQLPPRQRCRTGCFFALPAMHVSPLAARRADDPIDASDSPDPTESHAGRVATPLPYSAGAGPPAPAPD
ncbi:MAG: zinc-binding alcohol dehydrogenase, partial [Chloroflexi bacterium]|nr:zinc-binding alcohol dehydrogenase [Chloroflexota bacterium]